MKKWGNDTKIKYLGEKATVSYRVSSSKEKVEIALNEEGTYAVNGEIQQEEYDTHGMHIGNSGQLTDKSVEGNWHGSYLGPKNPKDKDSTEDSPKYSYSVPPTNYADYAAFQHDKDYDAVNAEGISGVFSLKTMDADKRLVKNLVNNLNQNNTHSMMSIIWSVCAIDVFTRAYYIKKAISIF